MGRTGPGVQVRNKSLRIRLSVGGQTISETVFLNGKPLPPTPANHKYAVRLASEIRSKLEHGTYVHSDYFPASARATGPGVPSTVADALDNWLKTRIGYTASTIRGYETAAGWWKDRLGTMALPRLVKSDILKALADQPKWTGKTRNNKIAVLRPALQLAVDDGLMASNPADSIPTFEHQRPEPDPFTANEREDMLTWFSSHSPEPAWNYFETMFFTGLRTSEGLGLRWDKVDLAARTVTIDSGLVDGEMTERTKTSRIRTVDLNSRALAALERQAKWTRVIGGRVFTDPRTGKPWADDQAPRKGYWHRAIKQLGLRYRDPYHMRHTAATMMLMAGAKPGYVARQLGHSMVVLTTIYAKWLDGDANAIEQAAIEKAIAGFGPGTGPADPATGTSR
jgi:integrase